MCLEKGTEIMEFELIDKEKKVQLRNENLVSESAAMHWNNPRTLSTLFEWLIFKREVLKML